MTDDEKSLIQLKAKMTEQQRSDMAEIIGNELKRREGLKSQFHMKSNVKPSALSGGLGSDDLRDVYESADKNIQQLRIKALESKVNAARKEASRLGVATRSNVSIPGLLSGVSLPTGKISSQKLSVIFFGICILFLAGMKSLKTTQSGIEKNAISVQPDSRGSLSVDPVTNTQVIPQGATGVAEKQPPLSEKKPDIVDISVTLPSSEAEKAVLMQLDQRRVELERRRVILDEKEKELVHQAKLVSEKVTELKSLTNKLIALRTEKDSKYSARLDQLASVYSVMAPNEASALIAKLDEGVALGLLERMPEKRMAQILGVMEQSRAIELTKLLTNRKGL